MIERELVDQAVRLLSTAIGILMEERGDSAIEMRLNPPGLEHFALLAEAGTEITALARAAEVLLRNREADDI